MSWDVVVPESEMIAARSDALALMVDAGKALRPIGGFEYVGGVEVEATTPLFGSDAEPVPCKIKPPRSVAPRDVEAGGRTLVVVPGEVHIPADPAHPEYAEMTVGDIWEMVAVSAMSLSRVARRYRITGEADGSLLTACRYTIERVVS